MSRIGMAYGVPYEEIARANRVKDPARIAVGQRLYIPGAKRAIRIEPTASAPSILPVRHGKRPHQSETSRPTPDDAPPLQWPVLSGDVTSGFGPRGGSYHDGIDIATVAGAPIRAAAAGEVAYSASLAGYGNVIVLRHQRGYATIYAHNERHHVKDKQFVRQGQLIATVGKSGRTTGTNLHFEVRKDNVAYDPLKFLPPNRLAGRSDESEDDS